MLPIYLHKSNAYGGFPTYTVFTTADPTTAIFGLCTHKWGIFALVGARISYRNGWNTEALIFENLKPVEITKKLF